VSSLTVALLAVGGIAGLLAVSAFFSSSGFAIISLTDEWFAAKVPSDDPELSVLRGLRSDPHRLRVTTLVGDTVVNVAIGSITTVLRIEWFPAGSAVTVATVLASAAVLIFGEIAPNSYRLGHAESWALRVARPISVVERVLYPLVAVFDFLTRRLDGLIGGEVAIEYPYVEE
jgi:CBS domain containing-hemolysin-like protein